MANPLESFKTLPPWGKIGVAVGGGLVVFYLYRAHTSNAAAASSQTSTATDPAGNTGTIDPATGYVYGSSQDSAALSGTGSSGSSFGTTYPYTGSGYNDTNTGATTPGSVTSYGDNAAWSQAVESGLSALGFSTIDIANALGGYLNRQPLSTAQAGIVMAAIASYGYPPVGSYTIIGQPQKGPASSGVKAPVISDGHVISVSNNDAVIGWTSKGTNTFSVKITGPGKINGHTSTVNSPSASYSGLEAGHDYSVEIQPLVAGKPSGKSGVITFKTKTPVSTKTSTIDGKPAVKQ